MRWSIASTFRRTRFAVVALHEIVRLAARGVWRPRLGRSRDARTLAARVQAGVQRYGRFYNAQRRAWMYAYETDGFGRYNLMDDANIPNLTTLPYIDWCSTYDPTYRNTRRFALSKDNPYFFSGRYAAGLGSPHTPPNFVWPLGIIGRALTATYGEKSPRRSRRSQRPTASGNDPRELLCRRLLAVHAREFGWANAFGAELFFRSLAGYSSTQFARRPDPPFEHARRRRRLVLLFTQVENAAKMLVALGRLLHSRARCRADTLVRRRG